MKQSKLNLCGGQSVSPRHFVKIAVPHDYEVIWGALYVPCDAPPAYWWRIPGGDLQPVPEEQLESLHRYIGLPRPAHRPPLRPTTNRLREALNPKPKHKTTYYPPGDCGF